MTCFYGAQGVKVNHIIVVGVDVFVELFIKNEVLLRFFRTKPKKPDWLYDVQRQGPRTFNPDKSSPYSESVG